MVGQGQFTRSDFLDAIFSQYYREHRGFILVRTVKTNEAKVATGYFPNLEVLGREIYGDDSDVYFGVCPRERMKPEKEHVKFVLALWGDIDIGSDASKNGQGFFSGPEEAATAIRDFPLPPSITVDSGHGLHLYWLLDRAAEAAEPAEIEKIIRKLQEQLNCRINPNLDALMRLPDTFNNKTPGLTSRCSVKFINVNFRYSIGDFKDITMDIGSNAKKAAMRFERETLTGDHPMEASAPSATAIVSSQNLERPRPISDQPKTAAEDHTRRRGMLETAALQENLGEASHGAPLGDAYPNLGSTIMRDRSRPLRDPAEGALKTQDGFFSRLIAEGKPVEIMLHRSDQIMTGKIEWVGTEWLGVREGGECYAIPVNSISFVRYKE